MNFLLSYHSNESATFYNLVRFHWSSVKLFEEFQNSFKIVELSLDISFKMFNMLQVPFNKTRNFHIQESKL